MPERIVTILDTGGEKPVKTWRHWLHDSGELLRMSERSGWCHLDLHDIATGELKHSVTSGAWPVREVVHVDAEKRQVWFLASGLREERIPITGISAGRTLTEVVLSG